jgi:glycosyltransferase involved in cell wall biosynthesis
VHFSVIVASHNAEATLPGQLAALSRQTFEDPFEVLVCDAGSRDGTRELAEFYHYRLPGLRILDAAQPPSSTRPDGPPRPGHARNIGALAARAPWLAFCDAEDEVAGDWLASLAKALRRHRFVAGSLDVNRLNRSGQVRRWAAVQQDGLQDAGYGPGLAHATGNNLAVHRDVFLASTGFDPEAGPLQDLDLCWRIQQAGTDLAFTADARTNVRFRVPHRSARAEGKAHGAAAALLHQRFGGEAPQPGPSALGVPRRGLAELTWRRGWHAGYRRWRAEDRVTPPAAPQPLSEAG